jgi:hypothetical protein
MDMLPSLLHILIEIRFSSRPAPFPLQKHPAVHWQSAVLLPYLPPLKFMDYSAWGVLKAKGNTMAKEKKWLSEVNHLANVGCQS